MAKYILFRNQVLCAALLAGTSGTSSASYQIVSTTVTRTGGWISAGDGSSYPRWRWSWDTFGGSTGATSDAYYQADMSFVAGGPAVVGPITYLLDRNDITIQFRVRYTGATPPPQISDIEIDQRFRLEADIGWIGGIYGTAYSSATSWYLDGTDVLEATAFQIDSTPYGHEFNYFPGPGPTNWQDAGKVSALFTGWSNTFPGIWETTVAVPKPSGLPGDISNTVGWETTEDSGNATYVSGASMGRWEYRLTNFGPFTQSDF